MWDNLRFVTDNNLSFNVMTINELLLYEFTQEEINQMSDEDRISIAGNIIDEMGIREIEARMAWDAVEEFYEIY